jgi:hypothetical protein
MIKYNLQSKYLNFTIEYFSDLLVTLKRLFLDPSLTLVIIIAQKIILKLRFMK